jgi:RsiW-degrading membrane proteinase PrsW (M82 family)
MKAIVISLAAGALCLPATSRFTRYGYLAVSIATIVTIAVLGTCLALWCMNSSKRHTAWWTLALSFCVGALVSEMVSFAYYYFDYGYADPKLGVGIALSFLEGGAIALIGGLSVVAAYFALRRITNASRAAR